MSEPARHRYPGPESFGDDDLDRVLFQGRTGDATRLVHLTLAEDVVVLYAKSGTGKTSLINTKLLQPLRERQFLPVVARVRDDLSTPAEAIFAAVRAAGAKYGLELVDGDRASLLSYFRTLEVWREDVLLTPVVILDQFEELFTVRTPEVRDAFARELAALRGRSADPASAGDSPPDGPDERRAPVKLVLSLREDSIGELEELSAFMPDVLRHRFRLGPLSEAEARAAIIEPAKLSDARLSTPPFEWKKDTVDRLIGFLHQRRLAGRLFTSRHVEPFQLQLICRHVEERVAEAHDAGRPVTAIDYETDIGGDAGAQRIMRGFYERQLAVLAGKFPLKRMRRLCEHGLITDSGRRAILDESTIARKYKLGEDALVALSRQNLIRVEPRGDEKRYELSHDTLVAPILDVREQRRARRYRRVLGAAVASVAVLVLAGFLVVRSDRFQEWAAIREGSAVADTLSGERDNVIQSWSLALGWAGDGDRAREAANAIEQPAARVVTLTRLSEALAALDANRHAVAITDILSGAIRIALRVPEVAERTRRLVNVATSAESLGLTGLARQTWEQVDRQSGEFGAWIPLVSESSNRRESKLPSLPGLDAAVDRLALELVDAMDAAVGSGRPEIDQRELGELLSVATRLLAVASDDRASRLALALGPFVSALVPERARTSDLVEAAFLLLNRGLRDQAVPLIDRAEQHVTSIMTPVERLSELAIIAHLLHRAGLDARASLTARRVRDIADREGARIEWFDLLQAANALLGMTGPGPASSADLKNTATALLGMAVRNAEGSRITALDQLAAEIVRMGVNDLARAILSRLAQAPEADKRDVVFGLWTLGDRDAALGVVEALPSDARARGLVELALMAKADGRPMLERGIEVALKTEDPFSRVAALASAVTWFVAFAPDEFDRALALVSGETNTLARQPVLEALESAARDPRLAGRVAELVRTLPSPVAPTPRAASTGLAQSATYDRGPEEADLVNLEARDRLVRLGLAETALTTLAGDGSQGANREAFEQALADARRLEGPERSEWLGRLGVLAARLGDFAEARRLAFETGDPGQRLTVLSAVVAVHAARRAPGMSPRIYTELFPAVQRL